jgi:hypothetical protein
VQRSPTLIHKKAPQSKEKDEQKFKKSEKTRKKKKKKKKKKKEEASYDMLLFKCIKLRTFHSPNSLH